MNPIVDAPECIDSVETSLETSIEVLRKAPNVSPLRLIVPTSIDEIHGRNSSATPLKTGNFSELIVTIRLIELTVTVSAIEWLTAPIDKQPSTILLLIGTNYNLKISKETSSPYIRDILSVSSTIPRK
ncbi:hypothetical protein Bca4012_050915 [Brassica carinata]